MPAVVFPLRPFVLAAFTLLAAGSLGAQAAKPAHKPVCGGAVRVYHDKADIKAAFDTLSLPPGPPVRVTSPEEAEAAELALRERAGSIGATGILVTTETDDQGDGNVRMHRNVQAVFVPSDSARAIAACKKS